MTPTLPWLFTLDSTVVNMENNPQAWQYNGPINTTVATGGFPRVGPDGYTAGLALTFALAIGIAGYRTYFRIRHFKKLFLDDYILFYVVAALITGNALAFWFKQALYFNTSVSVGLYPPPTWLKTRFTEVAHFWLTFNHLITIILYSAIFAVKLSYLVFFRKLIGRVGSVQAYWWTCLAILVPAGITAMFFPFFTCAATTPEQMQYMCSSVREGFWRAGIYLRVNTALDIATDVLVISVPLYLLAHVKIGFRRKVAVASILCLSIVMIVTAAVRLAFYSLPGTKVLGFPPDGGPDIPVADAVWLVYWMAVEANVSVIMVSATAFRGLFGQRRNKIRAREIAQRSPHDYMPGSGSNGDRSGTRTRVTGNSALHSSDRKSSAEPLRPLTPALLKSLRERRWADAARAFRQSQRLGSGSTLRGDDTAPDGGAGGDNTPADAIAMEKRFSVTVQPPERPDAASGRELLDVDTGTESSSTVAGAGAADESWFANQALRDEEAGFATYESSRRTRNDSDEEVPPHQTVDGRAGRVL